MLFYPHICFLVHNDEHDQEKERQAALKKMEERVIALERALEALLDKGKMADWSGDGWYFND